MNEANKSRLANILTIAVAVIAGIQGFFTVPPFSQEQAFIISGIFTYAVMLGTIWKQYLSPDVSNTGARITIFIAIAATLTGLADLFDVLKLSPATEQWTKWIISVVVMIINISSKLVFPSMFQKEKMQELKYRPAETKHNTPRK